MLSAPSRRIAWAVIAIALAAIVLFAVWTRLAGRTERRDDLWRVVHRVCGADQRLFDRPSPCVEVNRTIGFALVPASFDLDELLLVPTQRITGIEDPVVLSSDAPDYWQLAWNARGRLLDGRRAIPDDWVGLAVNSQYARTQDQLHIHIDCVKPAVHRALAGLATTSRIGWSAVEPLPQRRYLAKYVSGAELAANPPFRMLAARVGADPQAMGRQTLVLIGAPARQGQSGFYLLHQPYRAGQPHTGHGEELLDHCCSQFQQGVPD